MVKCPNCNHIFSIGSSICPRKVSITKKEKITNLTRHINKNSSRAEKFANVTNKISSFSNDTLISSKQILNLMNWSDHSDGDVTITFLDYLVCKGSLIKTRFQKGKLGHIYKKSSEIICPFFINGKCKCNINNYIHIDEEKNI